MTQYWSNVTFRFLQTGETSPSSDEIITLWHNGHSYLWVYRYASKGRRHVMECETKQQLYGLLNTYFKLLAYDTDPYASMQILPPAMPSVMLRMRDILPAFNTIESLLDLTFEVAPRNVPLSVSDALVEEYSVVDEMPGLVPLEPTQQPRSGGGGGGCPCPRAQTDSCCRDEVKVSWSSQQPNSRPWWAQAQEHYDDEFSS